MKIRYSSTALTVQQISSQCRIHKTLHKTKPMNIYLSTCVTEKKDDFRKKALIGPQFIHLLTTEPPQFPQVAENKISNKKNSKN